MASENPVERYYDAGAQHEWERQDRHRTVFAVTWRALDDYLPEPPAAILDIGGGPGRYSVGLARRGYAVTLFDLAHNNLAFAQARAAEAGVELAGRAQGNALDLSRFADAGFDAVLLMGPLYHLLELDHRRTAVREACRVLKPGGLIFASFITRYAPLCDLARSAPGLLLDRWGDYSRILETGQHQVGTTGAGFTDAYFAHPSEAKPLMEEAGFASLDLIACEGVVSMVQEQLNSLTGEVWERWVDLNYRLGKDPSVHGTAAHLLYVGRAPDHFTGSQTVVREHRLEAQ